MRYLAPIACAALLSGMGCAAHAQMANISADGQSSVTLNDGNLHPVWGMEVTATQAGQMVVTYTTATPSNPLTTPAPICIPLEPVPNGGSQTYTSWAATSGIPVITALATVTVSSGTSCTNLTAAATGTHITLWYQ